MKVLITGGAGYIGSTTARALELAGHVPVVLDSLVCGPRSFVADRAFYEGDVADRHLVARVLDDHPDIGCTIHMAARIVVPESVEQPYAYYRNNVAGSLELLDQLVSSGQTRVVFSSSASVYAPGPAPEVSEDSPTGPGSPYARSKLMIETVLADLAAATPLRAISLRYFNPVGADPSLTTGPYVRRPTHVLGQLLRRPAGSSPRSPSPAPTSRPATGRGCATTSTSGTSPVPTSAPSNGWTPWSGRRGPPSRSTSAPVVASRSGSWWRSSSR